jgi:V/A-type H+-transporting ATPase subunit E
MEVQLQDLIDNIKNKGIKQAEKEADEIKQAAQAEAKKIIADAKNKARELLEEAGKETEAYKHAADQALRQAGRDLLLSLKTRIRDLFTAVINSEGGSVLKSKVLEDVLLAVVTGWIKNGTTKITLLVAREDLAGLQGFLVGKLGDRMKEGVTIKPLPEIKAGFRIMETDGTMYYNLTDEGITEFLSEYLNPELAKLLDHAGGLGNES